MFVVKVPGIDGKGKTSGCEKSGNAVLDSLKEISVNEQGKIIDSQLLDLEEIHLDNSNLKLTNDLIYKNALKTFGIKPRTIFLGGDHSISYSLTRAFYEYCKNENKEPCLIVFDFSPNLKKIEQKNNLPDSNEFFPDSRQWLRGLIEVGFPCENILLVGIRDFSREEISFIKENRIKKISINNILEDIADIGDLITEFSQGRELYVSVDINVLDSAFVFPSFGNSSGGLSSRELIYFIQRLNRVKNLRAVDIVEINSNEKFNNQGVKIGAKILSELI